MCPVFALTLPCLKNGNGQREFDHIARSQAIMLKYFSVSVIAFPPLSPIIERKTVCKLQTQKQKARNDMQCSPPTSFTGVSMSSIAVYSSLTFIPAIVSGVALQITRKRHMGRAGTRFAVLLLLLVKALYGMPDSADRNT